MTDVLKALRALRSCFNDDGSLRLDAAKSQFEPVVDPAQAISIIAAADAAIAAGDGLTFDQVSDVRAIGDAEVGDPAYRLLGTTRVAGCTMHVEMLQVGYQPYNDLGESVGEVVLRTNPEQETPADSTIVGANDFADALFGPLFYATGSEGHLETIFHEGREYAVFIYPFST